MGLFRLLVLRYLAPRPRRPTASPFAVARAALGPIVRALGPVGRLFLRLLDKRFGHYQAAVIVLGHEFEPDPAALLVHLLHEHVDNVATVEHILDPVDPSRPDIGDVEQAVGPLLQLDEGAELGQLDDAPGVLVTDLRVFGHGADGRDRSFGVRA